jgi:endonuclease III
MSKAKIKVKPKTKSKAKKPDVMTYIKLLKQYYPDAHCALDHDSPEQLLIATVLSAQCTDERVNMVTKNLFKKYPKVKDLANANLAELEQDVRSTGFYKNKAKNLKMMAEQLIEKFNGQVPPEIDELVQLPGVGRKTANVVLGNCFNIASGVVVDTHVTRLSNRLGLTKNQDAVKIEQDLNKIIPKENWIQFSHWLITHGRAVCKARSPRCNNCFLQELCPSYNHAAVVF